MYSHKHLGNIATILYFGLPASIEKLAKEQGKEAGGAWECYHAEDFFGWEAEKVVAVTDGRRIMELITRARTHLSVLLVGSDFAKDQVYAKTMKHFQQAAELGLVEMVQLGAEAVVEVSDDEADLDLDEEEAVEHVQDLDEEETVEHVQDKSEKKTSCMAGCCTS